jgi:hypothetical protein
VHRIQKWWSLPALERRAFLHLSLLLVVVWVGLRACGFTRMRRWAEARPARHSKQFVGITNPEFFRIAQRSALLTEMAARRGIYRANCLHQSLALCYLLRRKGICAVLVMGVRLADTHLDAHAWVELDGQMLGSPAPGYAAFDLTTVK